MGTLLRLLVAYRTARSWCEESAGLYQTSLQSDRLLCDEKRVIQQYDEGDVMANGAVDSHTIDTLAIVQDGIRTGLSPVTQESLGMLSGDRQWIAALPTRDDSGALAAICSIDKRQRVQTEQHSARNGNGEPLR